MRPVSILNMGEEEYNYEMSYKLKSSILNMDDAAPYSNFQSFAKNEFLADTFA